ncbi:MAG: aminodeoxychorismate/anthranilate synthase component II [Armatimonadetes bacterium]|nr:aminodeoxychorismate/anthranilate synthase component II [Armatimonadota bacterium]
MILVIDNYDSFTYNLVQYLGELGGEPVVYRNDKISLEQITALNPERILLSPGPCTPKEAGICVPLIQRFAGTIPIFGVCLGHQSIGYAFGADVVRNYRIMHGKTSLIHHESKGVLAGLSNPFEATRYHSLVIKPETLPDCFEVTARTDEGEIMGVRHKQYAIEGVQFHPESALTLSGKALLANFVQK